MTRKPRNPGGQAPAPSIVLPVERAAAPPVGTTSAADRSTPSAPPAASAPSSPPAPSPGTPAPLRRRTPHTPRKGVPLKRTPLPGSAVDQAQHLRSVMRGGDARLLRRELSRLFRSGPARTAKVMKNLQARKDRPLLVRAVCQAAEDFDRALKVYDHLRVRGLHPCAVAVLFAAVQGRPGFLPGILAHLRKNQRTRDAALLSSATAVLADGRPTARMDADVVRVLRYTSYRGMAERQQARIERERRAEQAARCTAAPPTPGPDGESSAWRRFLRLLAALFRRSGWTLVRRGGRRLFRRSG